MKKSYPLTINNILASKKAILIVIFLLALGLRLGVVFSLTAQLKQPVMDAAEYDYLAKGLLKGNGLIDEYGRPSSYRMPLYPGFLAAIYFFFSDGWQAARIVQSFLGAFLVIIVYLISRIFLKENVSLLASFITAIYAPFIKYSYFGGPAFLLSENLFMFLLAVSTLFFAYGWYVRYNFLNIFLAGLFLGLATMTRPNSASLTVVYLGFIYFKNRKMPAQEIFKKAFPIIISMSILFIPWIIRNYALQGSFIPLTPHDGIVFYGGNNSFARGGWGRAGARLTDAEYEKRGGESSLSETQIRDINYKMAFAALKENPGRIPGLLIRKVIVFWMPFMQNERYNLAYGIMIVFAFLGALAWLMKKEKGISLFLWIFGCFTFNAIVFFGDPRFRYPIEPLLIIPAASGISWFWKLSNLIQGRVLFFAVLVFNCLVYLYWNSILLNIRAALRLLHLG